MLRKFNAYDSPSAKTSLELDVHLSKNRGDHVALEEYAKVIGSLMYLTNCMHLDLVRVLRYLIYSFNLGYDTQGILLYYKTMQIGYLTLVTHFS